MLMTLMDSASQWKDRDPLLWLLDPTTLDEFIDDYWERAPLIVLRQDPSYYSQLLTIEDVNEFMSRNDIRYPFLRLVKEGRELPLVDYADDFVYGSNIFPGLLDNDKVFHHYAEGATLSFQIFQKCMDSLSRFCNALEARLRFQTQVNIFVTPPSSKGFTAHYDDHSFFILQVSGKKHWKIYGNPVELPLQEFRSKGASPVLGEPHTELTLEAGDMLYLPKGYYHEAYTTSATSVHVTLGIFPYPWIRIAERLVSRLKDDIEFRRAPADYLRENYVSSDLQAKFDSVIARFSGVRVDSLLDELFAEAASKQIVDGSNRLRDLTRLESLCATSRIVRRTVLSRISSTENGLKLSFYDKNINFPAAAKEALEFIVATDMFTVNQMPSTLDDASNLIVVRKLIKEGLLSLPDA